MALALSALALLAARPPDEDRALAAAEALTALLMEGRLDAADPALRELVRPIELPASPRGQDAWYRSLAAGLAPGTPLHGALTARPPVLAVVRGPETARVVYDTQPPVTVLTRREGGATRVASLGRSACGDCGEAERFVRDLIEDVRRRGSASRRLLPGLELLVEPELARDAAWREALHNRNVGAGYLRWLLASAEVLGADGDEVQVALSGEPPRVETWTVVWEDGRWMLDHGALAEDSALRLAPEAAGPWLSESRVARARMEWWLPVMQPRAGGTWIADEVLFAAPRPGGELLVYTQDRARTAAFLLSLDADSGEVLRRAPMPALSQRVGYNPADWGRMFVGALDPTGARLALATVDQLTVLDAASLAPRFTTSPSRDLRALAWSPDGRLLAVGDGRGAVHLVDAGGVLATHLPAVGGAVHALLWADSGRLVAVWDDGRVRDLTAPSLEPGALSLSACCGAVRGATLDRGRGELLVGCAGACDPAFLWRGELLAEGTPEVLADEDFRAEDGTVSQDPLGRYRLTACSRPEGHAALWSLRAPDEPLAVFAEAPLRRVAWTEDHLFAVDAGGRLMRWTLAELVSSGTPP